MVCHVVALGDGELLAVGNRESLASLVGSLQIESDANPNKGLSRFLSRRVCRRGKVRAFLEEDRVKSWQCVLA